MIDRVVRSLADALKAPSPTSNGGVELFTLEGIDNSRLHEAIQRRRGELIFSTIPHAGLTVGVLGEAEGIKDVSSEKDMHGWKEGEVPVTNGVEYRFVCIDSYRHAEHDEGQELGGSMRAHLPANKESIASYTHNRGIQVVLDGHTSRIRRQIDKWDWILAVGNASVARTGLALAEKELMDRPDYIGLQESHGLLLLSAAKKLGVDWRSLLAYDLQANKLRLFLEQKVIEHGIVPVVRQMLDLDRDGRDGRSYWQLEKDRVARRVGALGLDFDDTKKRVLTALSQISSEEGAGEAQNRQRAVAFRNGGNYEAFVENFVGNLLENHFGIQR